MTKASSHITCMLLFLWIPIDCSHGDDETVECAKRKSKKDCSKSCEPNGHCHNLPAGPTCICPKGFKYDEHLDQCEVIEVLYWMLFSMHIWTKLNWFRISMSVLNLACVLKAVSTRLVHSSVNALQDSDCQEEIIERVKCMDQVMPCCYTQPVKWLIGSHWNPSTWNEWQTI